MTFSKIKILLPVFILVLFAGAEISKEDFDRNRRLLEKWKDDSDHYNQLLKDQAAFEELSESARNRLRAFDHDLDILEEGERKRLMDVLRRYGAWFDLLGKEEKKLLGEADSLEKKFAAVKLLLDKQWESSLPKKDREVLAKLDGEKKAAEVIRLKEEEKKRHEFITRPKFRPKKLADLPEEVRKFVETIRPRLTQVESERLARMEKKGVSIAKVIFDLAEAHPNFPAISPAKEGIKTFKELPDPIKKKLGQVRSANPPKSIDVTRSEGKWPEYAIAVTQMIRSMQMDFNYPFGASRPGEFPPDIKEFLDEILFPALTNIEKEKLQRTEGRWPDYPQLLREFARNHMVVIPEMSLPGPRDLWRSVRVAPIP